jgi:hydroxypyruvate isomerase
MPKVAANLTMLFNELHFLDRFSAASRAGFKGVEFLFPYDFEPEQLAEKLHQFQLEMVLHNLPAGHWAGGERGIACLPDRIAEFEQGVEQAIRYAKVLKTQRINCLVGIPPANVEKQKAQDTLVRNLKFAARELKAAGIPLLVEPINTFDIPGFFLSGTKQGLDLIEATTCSAWKASWRTPSRTTCPSSSTSSWPTTRAASNRAPARSTTASC